MSRIKPTAVSPDLLAASARPERFRPTASLQTVTPSKDDEDSLDNAREWLKTQWRFGSLVGLEIEYDGEGKTEFRLVGDKQHESQMLNQFVSHYRNAKLSVTQEPNLLLDGDEYVAATEFRLSNDYWLPLMGVADEDFRDIRDPLDRVISSMSKGGRSDVRYLFQVLAVPVEDSRWSRRWSLPYVGLGLMDLTKHWTLAGAYFAGFVGMLFGAMLTGAKKDGDGDAAKDRGERSGSYLTKAFSHAYKGISKPLARLIGFGRSDLVDKYDDKKTYYEEKGTKSAQQKADGHEQTSDRIAEKAGSHGYVTTMRLIAVGDDKQAVAHGINKVAPQVEDTYSLSGEHNEDTQGLTSKPARRSSDVKRVVSQAMERADGMDWHGRLTQRMPFRRLRTSRSVPTVLTPKALATLVHLPQFPDVQDTSVGWTSGAKGGAVPPDAPRFDGREH